MELRTTDDLANGADHDIEPDEIILPSTTPAGIPITDWKVSEWEDVNPYMLPVAPKQRRVYHGIVNLDDGSTEPIEIEQFRDHPDYQEAPDAPTA